MDCAEARAYVIILATTYREKDMAKAKAEKPAKDLSYRQSPDYVRPRKSWHTVAAHLWTAAASR